MNAPKIVTSLNLDENSPITGEQFVAAVIDNADLMKSVNPRSVKKWTAEKHDNGRRLAVTVEFWLHWNVSEKFYFYPLAAGHAGEAYYFPADSSDHRFVMKSDPQSDYGDEHFEAIKNWAHLFEISLLNLLRRRLPASSPSHQL